MNPIQIQLKERELHSPFLLLIKAIRHYYGEQVERELIIKIKIKGEEEDLVIDEKFAHEYLGSGNPFREKGPYFGRIEVKLDNGDIRKYKSYEVFAKKIFS